MNFLADAYTSTLNFMSNAYDNIKQTLFESPNITENYDISSTEQTAAPFNTHPMDFDITAKSLEEIPPLFKIISPEDVALPLDVSGQPPSLDAILNELLNSFGGPESTSDLYSGDLLSSTETILDIPDDNGHMFVKVLQDTTGKSIEFLHESQTEIFSSTEKVANAVTDVISSTEKVANAVTDVLNSTANDTSLNHKSQHSDEYYVNTYIIIALVLVIILYLSACGIWWFRKNRLRAEKRNAYPVLSVVNGEYMDPSIYKNCEKKNNIP